MSEQTRSMYLGIDPLLFRATLTATVPASQSMNMSIPYLFPRFGWCRRLQLCLALILVHSLHLEARLSGGAMDVFRPPGWEFQAPG